MGIRTSVSGWVVLGTGKKQTRPELDHWHDTVPNAHRQARLASPSLEVPRVATGPRSFIPCGCFWHNLTFSRRDLNWP